MAGNHACVEQNFEVCNGYRAEKLLIAQSALNKRMGLGRLNRNVEVHTPNPALCVECFHAPFSAISKNVLNVRHDAKLPFHPILQILDAYPFAGKDGMSEDDAGSMFIDAHCHGFLSKRTTPRISPDHANGIWD
jgi:hypothetical protein